MANLHSPPREEITGRRSLPPQNNYQVAFESSAEDLRNSDLIDRCAKSGATLEKVGNGDIIIKLIYLNRICEIRIPEMRIAYEGSEEDLPVWAKILILHYLNRSKGLALSASPITFRQVPGGSGYYPAYVKRALSPLVNAFGSDPKLLIEAAKQLGGWENPQGDASVTIPAFPHVPLTIIVWKGDEEFPASANILFDATITENLSTEDIEVLCQMVALKLSKWVTFRR